MTSYRLEAGERAVFMGQPKSGKTNLIMALLGGVSSAVVMDSKQHPEEWARWGPQNGYLVTRDPAAILTQPKVIFQVGHMSLVDRGGFWRPGTQGWLWTQALENVKRRRRKTVVVFDEVIQTLPSNQPHQTAMQLYTQGRAFGISCWAGTQVPNRMETLVIRLAEHCFCFWTGNKADVRMISDQRSVEADALRELPQHHYAYHRSGDREFIVCEPAPLVYGVKSAPLRQPPNTEEEAV